MNDLDDAWERAHRRFWKWQRGALAAHLWLYAVANICLILFTSGLPVNTARDFLRSLGIANIPWITINWGVLLLIHVVAFGAASAWERIFRRVVEYEWLLESGEKPKRRSQRLEWTEEDAQFDGDYDMVDGAYLRR